MQQNPRVLEAYLGREAEAAGRARDRREPRMLTIEELTTDYGPVRAVDDVSFEVPEGSVTAVLGANGAGKTSLLRTITGLVRPTSGRVKLAGRGHHAAARSRRSCGVGMAHVPEGRGVIAELTVQENLRLGGAVARTRRGAAAERSTSCSRGSRSARDQPASRLSGGERQMLSIGRALMGRPRVLLLDEPSLGLAPVLVAQIMSLVRRLRRHARPGRAARRAERAQRAVDRQPRHRAEPRAGRGRAGPGQAHRRRPTSCTPTWASEWARHDPT